MKELTQTSFLDFVRADKFQIVKGLRKPEEIIEYLRHLIS
jgi:hypothetical protein